MDNINSTDTQKGADQHPPADDVASRLGDFTTPSSVLKLLPLAIVIGVLGAFIALFLVALIGLITHVLYYGEISFSLTSPADAVLGLASILIPVGGGLAVGLMARYGSEQIRGHGIPEAIETILVGGSKVKPRLTVLKPLASAIAIGTGGPFGAEGPIILTGGATGSVLAQFLRLTAIERRTLLVAGAAAGMSAVFGTPIAAVLLGVELLLFEWKPRSVIPVAVASAAADVVRHWFAGVGWLPAEPLFPLVALPLPGAAGLIDALVLGVASGALAWVMTKAVYGAEDAYRKLPIHWMWWPALGGLIVGIGGLIEPRALGVGYDTIAAELAGQLGLTVLLSILVVKLIIWSIALSSGTSGGILAPILIVGAALGGLIGSVLPGNSPGAWALLGMAGALSGVTRSPFTCIVFAVELTHNIDFLLPLFITTFVAHLVSVLTLKRSILTEKVARRGFHLLREYAVEPLEVLFARDVISTDVLTLQPGASMEQIGEVIMTHPEMRRQRLLPVVTDEGTLTGAVSWQDITEQIASGELNRPVDDVMHRDLITAFPDDSLRTVADRMAIHEVGVLPIVHRRPAHRFCGLITQFELLEARHHILQEERKRERILHWRLPYFREDSHKELPVKENPPPEVPSPTSPVDHEPDA